MCDYWRLANPKVMPVDLIASLAPLILAEKPKSITLTGGEPLQHPHWPEIADLFVREVPVYLCTNGIYLRKYMPLILKRFSRLLVSIDGATEETFRQVRGVDGLEVIWSALQDIKAANPKIRINIKMTIQKNNYFEIIEMIKCCLEKTWLDGVGFAIPDLSGMAFAHESSQAQHYQNSVLLNPDEIERLETLVDRVYSDYGHLFRSGYIFEGNLERYVRRLKAVSNLGESPVPRQCSIPKYHMFVYPDGSISGCFFLPKDTSAAEVVEYGSLGIKRMLSKRSDFDSGKEKICGSCDQILFTNSPYESCGDQCAAQQLAGRMSARLHS